MHMIGKHKETSLRLGASIPSMSCVASAVTQVSDLQSPVHYKDHMSLLPWGLL